MQKGNASWWSVVNVDETTFTKSEERKFQRILNRYKEEDAKMAKFHELIHASNEITERIMEAEGELTPEIQAYLNFTIEEFKAKLDQYAHVMKRLEMEAVYVHDESARLSAISDRLQGAKDAIKARAKLLMRAAFTNELIGDSVKMTLSIRPSAKLVVDPLLLPPEFFKEKITLVPDKELIAQTIKDGVDVPGAHFEDIETLTPRTVAPKKELANE